MSNDVLPAGQVTLSDLLGHLQETIADTFEGKAFLVLAEIADMKPNRSSHVYLNLVERKDGKNVACIRGVIWSRYVFKIAQFEQATGTAFENGTGVLLKVCIRYHLEYGLSVDILDISTEYTLGKVADERQKTLALLVAKNPQSIALIGNNYSTLNKRQPFATVIQRVALITAAASDGQRDFHTRLDDNAFGYRFQTDEFLCLMQGKNAGESIAQALAAIVNCPTQYDAVAIVRGGGAQNDFSCFDEYELAKTIAEYPIPVITGIGHTRNECIIDLMAHTCAATPTAAAEFIIQYNTRFEEDVMELADRLKHAVKDALQYEKEQLNTYRDTVRLLSPENVLKRGYAIVLYQGKVVKDATSLPEGTVIQTLMKDHNITSTINKTESNGGNPFNL